METKEQYKIKLFDIMQALISLILVVVILIAFLLGKDIPEFLYIAFGFVISYYLPKDINSKES